MVTQDFFVLGTPLRDVPRYVVNLRTLSHNTHSDMVTDQREGENPRVNAHKFSSSDLIAVSGGLGTRDLRLTCSTICTTSMNKDFDSLHNVG